MAEALQTQWTARTILDTLHQHRSELRAMGVIKLGLFGSYVRDEQRSDSDMDFLFSIEPFTWGNWMDVWNFLEDVFQTKIDLVPEKDLRPELQRHVLPEVRYVQGL
jgi:hypothetical protein